MNVKVPEEIIDFFFKDEGKELHKLVNYIVRKNHFDEWFTDVERDEAFGVATDVFVSIIYSNSYESEKSQFKTFLSQCIDNKIKSYATSLNRKKRGNGEKPRSLDEEIDEETNLVLADVIASSCNVEEDAIGNCDAEEGSRAKAYRDSLPKIERQIVDMILEKKTYDQIRSKLSLTKKEFDDHMSNIRSSDRKRILTNNTTTVTEKEITVPMMNNTTTTREASKETLYTADQFGRAIKSCRINADHPQQRQSNQWSRVAQSDLIVTMLHGYTFPRIVLAEQTKGGSTVQWLVDGKQRITTITDYRDDGFKISKKAQRTVIKYTRPRLDENGKQILRPDGYPDVEEAEFDVRGKSYKQLPPELQEKIDTYPIGIDLYLNCDDDEVEYHILRFNQAKPMTVSQRGITHLGREFAQIVKGMARLPFFTEGCGTFTAAEFSNGTIDRVIVESVMAIYFLDNWKKSNSDAAEFLKAHATRKEFDGFEDILGRISELDTDRVKDMFTAKDTFLWMAIFAKFDELEIGDDDRFVDFMEAFRDDLCNVQVDGISYAELCGNGKATKDRSIVKRKLALIEAMMHQYFGIEKEETIDEFEVSADAEEYIEAFSESELVKTVIPSATENNLTRAAMQSLMLCAGITDLSDRNVQNNLTDYGTILSGKEIDVSCYLDDMATHAIEVELPNELYSERNIPAIVAVYDYAYVNDYTGPDFDEWIKKYAENFAVNKPFTKDIVKNRDIMIADMKRYADFAERGKTA